MTYPPQTLSDDLTNLAKLPAWITSRGAETFEIAAFQSGAALMGLDRLLGNPSCNVPLKLLANRLALSAATATSKLEGRMAQMGDIRDAYHLTAEGQACGPDGDLLGFWREAVHLRPVQSALQQPFGDLIGDRLKIDADEWLKAGEASARTHGPLAGCVTVLRAVLRADDRAERVACLLADMVIARALNWNMVLPITAQRLTKTMLRRLTEDGPGAALEIQLSMLAAIKDLIHLSRDLTARAAALRAVAPKLRAKGSAAAVGVFLSEDAVAPSTMLSPMVKGTSTPMTGRAARRLCDRLVELGVARELTGRPSFRLYGIGP